MAKKILVINAHDLDTGAGRSCADTLVLLAEKGYQIIHVARFHGQIENLLARHGIPTFYCDFPAWYPQLDAYGKKMNLIRRTRYAFHSMKVLLKSHSYITSILKEENFVPDLVYTNTILWYMGLFIARNYKCPHFYHIREYGMADFNMYFVLGRRISSFISRRYTQKAFCISKGVLDAWKDFFEDKAILIYNGIKLPQTQYHEHHLSPKEFHILIVGRLSSEKGQSNVIKVLPKIISKTNKKIILDLYGSGSEETYLKKIVSNLSLYNVVRFCGFSDNIDYSSYDLAIMSSRSEGFGRTTVEYMLNHIPVLGFKGGATPELIEDDITGKLYCDDNQLVEYICDAINDYAKYLAFAQNAYEKALDNFSLQAYQNRILREFDNCL